MCVGGGGGGKGIEYADIAAKTTSDKDEFPRRHSEGKITVI